MTREKARELMVKLNTALEDSLDKYLNEIYKVITQYYDDDSTREKFIKEIVNVTYQALESAYKLVSKKIKENYKRTSPFTVENVLDLGYHSDGKDLKDRISSYLGQGFSKMELLKKFHDLLLNEARIVESCVIKGKLSKVASILVIECNESDCHLGCSQYEGEYPADENVPLPPYHPNCGCTYYYVETDDEDDIRDLDLEVEESN